MKDAIERLRRKAQNEATCFALARENDSLRATLRTITDALRFCFELEDVTPFCDQWEFIDDEYQEFNKIYACATEELRKLCGMEV